MLCPKLAKQSTLNTRDTKGHAISRTDSLTGSTPMIFPEKGSFITSGNLDAAEDGPLHSRHLEPTA